MTILSRSSNAGKKANLESKISLFSKVILCSNYFATNDRSRPPFIRTCTYTPNCYIILIWMFSARNQIHILLQTWKLPTFRCILCGILILKVLQIYLYVNKGASYSFRSLLCLLLSFINVADLLRITVIKPTTQCKLALGY